MPYLIIAVFIGLALTIYIGYRASMSDRKLFSISLIALFTGVLYESFRISENWKKVIGIFALTYILSMVSFLPGKYESTYNFESHIKNLPYFFIFIFALLFGIFHKDRVTAKLTERITLILSISLVYWAIDYGFINFNNWFSISLMTFGFLMSIYSILNALTKIKLSRTNRLTLSIWSSIVMFAFAIDNTIRVFNNPEIENSISLLEGLYIGIQYFLLGVSAVYIMQNFMLLAAFLPSKNGNYKKDLAENKKEHIKRFSDEQVNIEHSVFCISFTVIIYGLNYKYQIFPRHTMIWMLLFTFPIISNLIAFLNIKRKAE